MPVSSELEQTTMYNKLDDGSQNQSINWRIPYNLKKISSFSLVKLSSHLPFASLLIKMLPITIVVPFNSSLGNVKGNRFTDSYVSDSGD